MAEIPPGYTVRRAGATIPDGYTVRQSEPGFQFGEMVRNIPGSTVQLADDVTYPFRHPIETAKAMGNLAEGVLDKVNPDILGGDDKSAYIDAVSQYFMDRYGSVENALQSLESDPAGVLSDVGGLISGGATTAAKVTGKGAKLANMLQYADPVVAAGRGLKAGPGRLLAKAVDPNDLYTEVMKFNTTDSIDDARKWSQTALDEHVTKSADLTGKFSDKIDLLTEELTKAIDAADPHDAAPVERVLRGLDDLEAEKTGFKIESAKDREIIEKFREEFLAEHGDKQYVTARELQNFKTDLYDKVYKKRKRGKGLNTREDVYKHVGRQTKEAIEEVVPEVERLNSQLGELLDARDPLMQKWRRIDNRNKISLYQILAGLGGAGAGGASGSIGDLAVGAGAGLLLGEVFRPETQARMAVALNELLKHGGNARLVDSSILRGLTNGQVMQLEKLAGRYMNSEAESEADEEYPGYPKRTDME